MNDIVEDLREWRRRETAALDGESYETEMVRAAADEIERLRAALFWIDTFDPETIAAAEAQFGFKLYPGAEKDAGG